MATRLQKFSQDNVNFEVVRALVNAGADINHRKAAEHKNALFCAVIQGDEYIVRFLLNKGANANDRYTLESLSVPFILYDYKSLVDALSIGATALMIAAAMGHQNIVTALLHSGADASITVNGKHGVHSARSLAAEGKYGSVLKILDQTR